MCTTAASHPILSPAFLLNSFVERGFLAASSIIFIDSPNITRVGIGVCLSEGNDESTHDLEMALEVAYRWMRFMIPSIDIPWVAWLVSQLGAHDHFKRVSVSQPRVRNRASAPLLVQVDNAPGISEVITA